jgi:hemolysin III
VAPDPAPVAREEARPLLRGWLHLVCAFVAAPAAVWLVMVAGPARSRAAAAVYAAGLVALFAVSGSYHRGRWSPPWRARLRRLDHSTIFVMIAGTYTPLCLVVLRGWTGVLLLTVAWAGAATGVVLAWRDGRRSAVAHSALYLVLGWAALVPARPLAAGLDGAEIGLLVAGGLLFTVGAASFAVRWPDPFPRTFGYHEVWHVLVVAAVVCQFLAISSVVGAPTTL